jgi:crotonobetainyl-CoA:carnitine CoA-transferase CaiB-like acyl-CoA transferase
VSDYESLMRRLIREELREQLPSLLAEALAADRAAAAEQSHTAAAASASDVLTVDEVAAVARRHPDTVRLALADGTLHGQQQRPRGKWTTQRSCAEAWILASPCAHQLNVTPMRRPRTRT